MIYVFKSNNSASSKSQMHAASNAVRRLLFTIIAIVCMIAIFNAMTPSYRMEEVALSDVITRANDENGNIKKITVSGNNLEITLKDNDQPTQKSRKDGSGTLYEQGLIDQCASKNGDELKSCQEKYPVIEYKEPVDVMGTVFDIAMIVLPIIAIVIFFSYMMRQAQNMNNQSMGFGKAKAKLYGPDKKKVVFDDVAGNEAAKQDLTEIVDFLKNPKKIRKTWRQDPAWRTFSWRSWYRQNSHGPRRRWGSQCPVLQHFWFRICRNVRRCWRFSRPRFV